MPRSGEDRSDVGGAAQFNNIGPVPPSCPAFSLHWPAQPDGHKLSAELYLARELLRRFVWEGEPPCEPLWEGEPGPAQSWC